MQSLEAILLLALGVIVVGVLALFGQDLVAFVREQIQNLIG